MHRLSASASLPVVQEKVITDVLLVDQPIKRFVKPEEVGAAPVACWVLRLLGDGRRVLPLAPAVASD